MESPADRAIQKRSINLWGLVTAAGAVTLGASGLSFLGSFGWIFDLFTHFRVQYFFGLLFAAVLLLIWKRYRSALFFTIGAAVNLALIAPLYFRNDNFGSDSTETFRIVLINVNTHSGDPELVEEFIRKDSPDLLVLEEIDSSWTSQLQNLHSIYPHSEVVPRDDNFGIGFYSKVPILTSSVDYFGSAGVPSISANLTLGSDTVRIIATHPLPPVGSEYSRHRNEQFESIIEAIHTQSTDILIGDLNATHWSSPYRKLIRSTGLNDSAKGFGPQPSWPSSNFLLRIPIDHMLHSDRIRVSSRSIGSDVGSDHFPLVVDFSLRDD